MDTRELEWFVRLAQDANVTRVARELHVTQSTLSRSIARVEAHFGAQLFDRHGRRLTLNVRGQAVAQHAHHVLDELRMAQADLEQMGDPTSGTIRLGYMPWLGLWFVPELLRQYRSVAPMVRFTLSCGTAKPIFEDLRRGVIELLLTTVAPAAKGISGEVLLQAPMYLAVARNHRLAGRKSASVAELRDEEFIVPGAESEQRRLIEDMCRESGFTPRLAFESSRSQPDTIRGFVAAGLGVAIRPGSGISDDARLVYIPLSDTAIERTISLVWREGYIFPDVAAGFKKFVKTAAPRFAAPRGPELA